MTFTTLGSSVYFHAAKVSNVIRKHCKITKFITKILNNLIKKSIDLNKSLKLELLISVMSSFSTLNILIFFFLSKQYIYFKVINKIKKAIDSVAIFS